MALETIKEYDDTHQDEINIEDDMDDSEMLSHLVPPNTIEVSDIETLSHRFFDLVHVWME